jgi:hypothetical protein
MGGTLHPHDQAVSLSIKVGGISEGLAKLVANGSPVESATAEISTAAPHAVLRLDRQTACGWISVNVVDPAGQPLLIGNPIYIDCRQSLPRTGGN